MGTNAPATAAPPAAQNATLAGLFGMGLVNPATAGVGLIAPMPLAGAGTGAPPPITSAFNYQGGGALPANTAFPFGNLFPGATRPGAPTLPMANLGAGSPVAGPPNEFAGGAAAERSMADVGPGVNLNPAETTFGSVGQIPGIGPQLSRAFDWLGQAIGNAFGGRTAGVDVVNAAGAASGMGGGAAPDGTASDMGIGRGGPAELAPQTEPAVGTGGGTASGDNTSGPEPGSAAETETP